MGTRADFYVGRGDGMEWVGSIAWDGYPDGIVPRLEEQERRWSDGPLRHKTGAWPEGESLFDATTLEDYGKRLARFFQYRDDVTFPWQGWPWPWETSHTTDYAYAFDNGTVWASCFGSAWWKASEPEPEDSLEPKAAAFPDMSGQGHSARVGSKRSGVMVVSAPIPPDEAT